MTMAVFWSKAWMPRKSSFSASGGVVQRCQVAPSSVVRRMVPSVPLAHATPLPMEWMPRRLAVVWESWELELGLGGGRGEECGEG
jgi:hypothetical protein